MRYKFSINGKNSGHEIIGDGVVVSTPFGSTGYYRSITDSFFEVGIGLAFNNSTEQSDHMVLSEDSEIEILITRGPANIYADNQSEVLTIEEGKITTIKKSDKFAKIIRVQ
jgi:NAD+ kinase